MFSYEIVEISVPHSATEARKKDFDWLVSHAVKDEDVPMWVQYNSEIFFKNWCSSKQNVLYMQNYRKPITSIDVIQDTMITAQKCAIVYEKKIAVVLYDLAAAKPTMQIQTTERPRFDDVFIMPGAFHIQCTFFKAIGKIIAESGGPDLLIDSKILAVGSLDGFINAI